MNQTPVEEFTTPNPVVAAPSATITELQALMTEHGIRHVPIADGDEIVGIVSERDIKVALGLNKELQKMVHAEEIMAADPISVYATDPLDEVALTMSRNKIGSVLVYDEEDDELVGIFTSTDALNALIEIVRGFKEESN